MADTLVSLRDFLENRKLTRKDQIPSVPQARLRLENSELLKTMGEICTAINDEAGCVVVEEHRYLPPEPVVSSYTFAKGQSEYIMRLELWGSEPSLLFVRRKWRDDPSSSFLRWAHRILDLEALSVNVKFACEIRVEVISAEEIKRCFFYLLSELHRGYRPAFQSFQVPANSRGRE